MIVYFLIMNSKRCNDDAIETLVGMKKNSDFNQLLGLNNIMVYLV